ncbi:MAG: ornithine cyclodeaminase [Planctomycetota bacterium]|jgi:ornithine cyclodeaminase|nr:ornithine cyclodeaminase [Planctomycetota bacterium]
MPGKRTEFLYLSEADTIAAGVLDVKRCIEVAEETFALLSEGDYLMGGPNHNSHGMGIIFPKETKFPNMPVAGPDRRFFAMPAYLGGRYDVCGVKWYGSNHANPARGLPRSVLTVQLNDKDTGEPLCLMSANLLSAARTGAVPGVAARHLARRDAETAAAIGCGPINESCFQSIRSQLPGLKKLYCFDVFEDKAKAFADWAGKELGLEGVVAKSLEECVRSGEVITVAASRLKPLFLESAWLNPGTTVLLSGPARADDAFWAGNRIVYDHVHLHEAYVEEAVASGDKAGYYAGVIGGPIYTLIDAGKIQPLAQSTGLGDIVRGKAEKRTDNRANIIFVACGMPVFDVSLAYELWDKAKAKGIGTKLLLWDSPHMLK